MKKILRALSVILVIAMILPLTPDVKYIFNEISAMAINDEETDDNSDEVENNEESVADETSSEDDAQADAEEVDDTEITDKFAFPDSMKAVRVVPGKDYFKDADQSIDTTKNEIDNIINNLNTYGMNSIIIDTNYEDMSFYSLDAGLTNEENALKMLIDEAKDNYLYVYINFKLNHIMNDFPDSTLKYKINYLTQIAHKFSGNYFIDGIILDGYYSSKNLDNYKYYAKDGSGIGFENWLLDNGAYVFSLVSNSIHKTDSRIPVGINISDAWANKSENEDGSDTNDSFQALTDGYSDTVNYIENGYADFIMLTADGAIDDADMPFKTVTNWWSQKAVSSDIPMFVCHTNEKLCTDATGWISDDQILNQLIGVRDMLHYKGSAFNSYSSLVNNYTGNDNNKGTTDVLINYYDGQINEDALSNELEMNIPTKTNFTTNEPSQIFQGSFDENFKVTLNGEPVEINEAGYFFIEKDLNVGWNEFTFKSKAKEQTYKIYRDIQIFQSIDPQSNMKVEGETTITVSAMAYKGTTVTASLNGKPYKMYPTEGEITDQNSQSSYTKYSCSISTPQGIVSKEQDLGNIVITGNYKGIKTTTKTGGRITVNALPEEAVAKDVIEVLYDNTMTYDYYTTATYTVPTCPRLPAGTKDYVVKSVKYGGTKFYLTESGKRIKASDVRVVSGHSIVNNTLSVANTYIDSNGDTVIKIKLDQRIPFDVLYSSTNYYTYNQGNYNVKSFNSTKVTIEFSFVSSASGLPDFPAGSVFSSASWSTSGSGTKTKQQLNLNLAQNGIYSGITTTYSSDGYLLLKFNDYNTSLSGSTIVIDPGHGLTANGFDTGSNGHVTEQSINISVARKLTAKLKSMGANAYMLETGTQLIDRKYRPEIARQKNADMYISIHCNGIANGSGTRGTEVYYFNSFSQPLAKTLVDNLGYAWKNQIYGDGVNRIRGSDGTFWNWFDVTLMQDFPSVLVELGFVTDYTEAMALYNSSNQDILVNALVNGINSYYARK